MIPWTVTVHLVLSCFIHQVALPALPIMGSRIPFRSWTTTRTSAACCSPAPPWPMPCTQTSASPVPARRSGTPWRELRPIPRRTSAGLPRTGETPETRILRFFRSCGDSKRDWFLVMWENEHFMEIMWESDEDYWRIIWENADRGIWWGLYVENERPKLMKRD